MGEKSAGEFAVDDRVKLARQDPDGGMYGMSASDLGRAGKIVAIKHDNAKFWPIYVVEFDDMNGNYWFPASMLDHEPTIALAERGA